MAYLGMKGMNGWQQRFDQIVCSSTVGNLLWTRPENLLDKCWHVSNPVMKLVQNYHFYCPSQLQSLLQV